MVTKYVAENHDLNSNTVFQEYKILKIINFELSFKYLFKKFHKAYT